MGMNYLWHILVMVSIYAVLAASLNLVTGYAGLLSLCHAAFFGIGAYTTTLLMMKAGLGFFASLSLGIPITGLLSLIIAIPALRLRGDYFVLATLGFQIIVFSLLYNWERMTHGPNGIPGIPRPSILEYEIGSVFCYFLLSGFIATASLGLIWLMVHSPFGRLLRSVREDEIAAAALGKNVPLVKTTAFALGAAIAAIPGSLFAGYMRYIDPTSFTTLEAIFILSIVVIGGAGSFWGPIVGATFMVILPEVLRFLQLSDAVAANLRQIIFGLLLILLMRFRPQGFLGEYDFK
jgi:branched-chain amino acid transport system permease protein